MGGGGRRKGCWAERGHSRADWARLPSGSWSRPPSSRTRPVTADTPPLSVLPSSHHPHILLILPPNILACSSRHFSPSPCQEHPLRPRPARKTPKPSSRSSGVWCLALTSSFSRPQEAYVGRMSAGSPLAGHGYSDSEVDGKVKQQAFYLMPTSTYAG